MFPPEVSDRDYCSVRYACSKGRLSRAQTVDYSKFDRIYFAFALPTAKGGLYFTQNDSVDLLQRLVTGAHTAGKEVVVSVGGWTGSTYFSSQFCCLPPDWH